MNFKNVFYPCLRIYKNSFGTCLSVSGSLRLSAPLSLVAVRLLLCHAWPFLGTWLSSLLDWATQRCSISVTGSLFVSWPLRRSTDTESPGDSIAVLTSLLGSSEACRSLGRCSWTPADSSRVWSLLWGLGLLGRAWAWSLFRGCVSVALPLTWSLSPSLFENVLLVWKSRNEK